MISLLLCRNMTLTMEAKTQDNTVISNGQENSDETHITMHEKEIFIENERHNMKWNGKE